MFLKKKNLQITGSGFFLRPNTGLSNCTGRNSFLSARGLGPALVGVQIGAIPPSLSVSSLCSGLGCLLRSLPGDQTPVNGANYFRISSHKSIYIALRLFSFRIGVSVNTPRTLVNQRLFLAQKHIY